MEEADAAWAARIAARFEQAHLEAIVARARLRDPHHARRLLTVLKGRLEKILARYLTGLSPLSDPELVVDGRRQYLCLRDLRVGNALGPGAPSHYGARWWMGPEFREARALTLRRRRDGFSCAVLPPLEVPTSSPPLYRIVDVWGARSDGALPPTRVHFYDTKRGRRMVGLERPDDHAAPGG
jgi:hypothetical protein